MAEVHMLLYLGSYEWGSSLIDQEEFLKSIELDTEVAYDTFFRELPDIIISRSGRITKGLIDALSASGYDRECIIKIWRNVFCIMKLRFPNLEQHSIDFVSGETEEPIGLRNCLLTRFVDGGKEQFLAAYAYLADKAEENRHKEFVESVNYCLEQFEHFNLVTQIAIVDLIKRYSFQLPEVCQKRLSRAIDNIYPTGNVLLDVILSEFTVYTKMIARSSDKHAPDCVEQEDVEFYLAENMYSLGTIEQMDIPNDYARNSFLRDPIMKVLKTCGINYEDLYVKLHTYIAVNQNQEVIFIMKNWQSCYRGDSDYTGYAIPLYIGTELYIKTDYLPILQEHYGSIYLKTKVEKIT